MLQIAELDSNLPILKVLHCINCSYDDDIETLNKHG